MKLLLTREAAADLERIADHIARESLSRALSFVAELRQRTGQLLTMPKACPLVPRFENRGVRRCVHGNYLIFYRLDEDKLVVIHVLHGAMDYEPLLFPD